MLSLKGLKFDRVDATFSGAENKFLRHCEVAFMIVADFGNNEDTFLCVDFSDFHSGTCL